MTTTILTRDAGLRQTGQVEDFLSLSMVLRFNAVSTWLLELDAASPSVALLGRSDGVIVRRDGMTLLSGPVVKRQTVRANGRTSVTVSGVDDTAWLARRLALPVPAGPPYVSAEYDDKSGPAESVMRYFVDRNLGPSATPARQLPLLTLPPDQARGTSVRGRGRFHPLLDLLTPLALAGGDLGFRIVQVGAGLEFQVYAPADRTATAVFSEELGNLAGFTYEASAPVGDYLYVLGQGEGTARAVVEGPSTSDIMDAYGRIELVRDRRDTVDAETLNQALREAFIESVSPTSLSLSPIDTAAVSYGLGSVPNVGYVGYQATYPATYSTGIGAGGGYVLGDRVTVVVQGEVIRDVVREVALSLTPDRGEVLTPVVGTPGAQSPAALALFARQDELDRRIDRYERR